VCSPAWESFLAAIKMEAWLKDSFDITKDEFLTSGETLV